MQYNKLYFTILLSISIASAAQVNNENQVQVTKYEYVTLENGGYKFEFETSDGQTRSEEGISRISAIDGTTIIAVTGSFSYNGDDGKRYTAQYTSDEYGYRAYGDHINSDSSVNTPEPIAVGLPPNALISLVG